MVKKTIIADTVICEHIPADEHSPNNLVCSLFRKGKSVDIDYFYSFNTDRSSIVAEIGSSPGRFDVVTALDRPLHCKVSTFGKEKYLKCVQTSDE